MLEVEPPPSDDELAAILAALAALRSTQKIAERPLSRWRAAGRVYDEAAELP